MSIYNLIVPVFGILLALVVSAEAGPGTVSGGVVVPVIDPNGTSCIDVTKQSVSMLVLGLKAQRYSSWFSETKQVGVKVDVLMTAPTGTKGDPSFTFPRALTLTPIGKGDILTLPIVDYPIMTNYTFMDKDGNPFVNVGTSLSFIDVTGSNALASSITTLVNFSKSLPIPANPYEQGVQYFGNFVNTLVTSETDANSEEPLASVHKDLYRGVGTCKSSQLHEGTYAIVYDFVSQGGLFAHSGNAPAGTLDTSTIATSDGPTGAGQKQYCFFLSGGSVTYADQAQAPDCAHDSGPRLVLNNPQMVVETVAYDLPQKAANGKVVADLAVFKTLDRQTVANLTQNDFVNAAPPVRSATSKLHANLASGTTLENSVSKLGGVNAAPNTLNKKFTVSAELGMALANLRAAARCKNVGIPPKFCLISTQLAR